MDRKRLARLLLALLCLNLAFIWGNSAQDADSSHALSGWLTRLLGLPAVYHEAGDHILRKLAHFLEFTGLGVWTAGLACLLGQTGLYRAGTPLGLCLAAACVDETIQMFSAGRTSSLLDVWLDTFGAAVGIILLLGVLYLRKHRNSTNARKLS